MSFSQANKVYFHNLDALRAFACFFVFASHFYGYINTYKLGLIEKWFYDHSLHELGAIGVNLFFVLSGFLISFFLLSEKKKTTQINFKNFYIKRILRIWPVFFLVTAISFFVLPILTNEFDVSLVKGHLPYYLAFINNFDRINTSFTGLGNDTLGVLWSIAVEEQFYLIWPIFIYLIKDKYLSLFFIIVICISVIFRANNFHSQDILYYHTFSLIGDLVIGSWGAYFVLYSKNLKVIIQMPRFVIVIVYTILGCYLLIGNQLFHGIVLISLQRVIVSILFALVILEQSFSENSFFKFGNLKRVSSFALFTYGFYCYHTFFIMVIQKINRDIFTQGLNSFLFYFELIVVFIACYLFSVISYNYYEKFFLNKRSKFIKN